MLRSSATQPSYAYDGRVVELISTRVKIAGPSQLRSFGIGIIHLQSGVQTYSPTIVTSICNDDSWHKKQPSQDPNPCRPSFFTFVETSSATRPSYTYGGQEVELVSNCTAKRGKGEVHGVQPGGGRGEFMVRGQAGEGRSSWCKAN